MTDQNGSLVSIIVPTYNEERNLPRLLQSITAQQGVPYELLVVDQESTDRTTDIARQFGAQIISRQRPDFYSPPSESRNVGADAATGDVLLHLDADMELPDPQFLQRCAALFDQRHEAVVIHETDIASGWWNRVKAVERACYWDSNLEFARGVTADLFAEVGGYDQSISSGEDAYIHSRYVEHTEVARTSDVWLRHHTGRMPLSRLLRKKFSYGRTASAYLGRIASDGGKNAQTNLIRDALVAYQRNAVRMLRTHPLLFLCVFPLRMAELGAVRLGIREARRKETSAKASVEAHRIHPGQAQP